MGVLSTTYLVDRQGRAPGNIEPSQPEGSMGTEAALEQQTVHPAGFR